MDKHWNSRFLFLTFSLVILLLVSCSGASTPNVDIQPSSTPGEITTESQIVNEPSAYPEPMQVDQPDGNAYPAPPEQLQQASVAYPEPATDETPKATPRPELEATAPENVELAAGKLQLVEFFAFW